MPDCLTQPTAPPLDGSGLGPLDLPWIVTGVSIGSGRIHAGSTCTR